MAVKIYLCNNIIKGDVLMNQESYRSTLAKAILAGILIGMGGIVYLKVENKYLGGFLFSFGLFTIIKSGFALYTGKVGYIPEKKPVYVCEVLVTFIGNVIGTGITALLVRLSRIGTSVHENAVSAMSTKMNDTIVSRFILGIFCGLLMYLAVDGGKRNIKENNDVSFVFGTAVPVMIFIFCGFNHSVADCFYMFAADASVDGYLYILTVALGNAAGGMLIPLMKKLFDKT